MNTAKADATSLVIELCGLPGAGKSSLAARTAELMAARGVRCEIADVGISAATARPLRAARRLSSAGSALARDPGWAALSFRRFARVPQGAVRDTAAPLLQWLAVASLTGRARRSTGLHLLEEGFIQTLWTLLLRAPLSGSTETTLRTVADLMQEAPARVRSDLVILLDVPVDCAAARLEARASRHSRTQRLPVHQRAAELEHGRRLLESLVAVSPAPMHRLSAADHGPAELAAAVAQLVLSHR